MLFAAVLFLYGCIDRGYPYDPDIELSFDPCCNLQEFGASVWDYSEDGNPSSGTILLDNERIVRNGEIWAPAGAVLWPAKDRKVCVLAYAPYDAEASVSLERGVEFKGIDIKALSGELLYSNPVSDISKGDGGVIPITFSEALCKMSFRMRTNAFPVETVELKSLKALSLNTKGDFKSLPSPSWSVSGTAQAVTLAEGSYFLGGEPMVISEKFPLIPQQISTVLEAEIDYTDTNGLASHWVVSTETKTMDLIPGRSYCVDLLFNVETCTLTMP